MNIINRKCPICSNEKTRLIFNDHNRREGYNELEADYVECTKCSMKYLTKIPDFDSFSKKYEDIYIKPNIEEFKNNIYMNIKKNGLKVLDIGCNQGIELIKYKNKGFDIYGIDLNKKAIVDCKKYLPENNFYVSTIENTPFQDNYFDIITTSHVLEHVYELNTFLSSVQQLLKKGGTFIVKVPNGGSLEMKIWGKYASQSWIPFHINFFTKSSMKKILNKHGFKSIKFKTNTIPWWWILSFRQLKGNINIKRGETNFNQNIFHKILQIFLLPILLIISKIGYGEELEMNCNK